MRDADAHRRLAPLVFIDLDQTRDFRHVGRRVASLDNVGDRPVFFHVQLHDAVEHLIRRQGILVQLVGAQFGRRPPRQDTLGYHFRHPVTVRAQAVHEGLGDILDDGKAARHVAVQGAITDGHLALVARRQDDAAVLVRQGHQQGAADARLDVLFRRVFRQPRELAGQGGAEGIESLLDRNFIVAHIEAFYHVARIDPRDIGRELRRHHDGAHLVGAQRIDGNGQGQGGIDAARHADQHAREAVLADIVAHAQHQRLVHLRFRRQRRGQGLRHGRGAVERDELQVFREMAQLGADRAGRIHDKRVAVEDQLILAAHQVGVDEGHALRADVAAHGVIAQVLLVHVIRRAVRHQQHLRAGRAGTHGGVLEPRVFADIDAETHALHAKDERLVGRGEVALFIENSRVRQVVLAVGAQHFAVQQHGGGIVAHALFILQGQAHHHVQILELGQVGSQPGKRLLGFCVECIAQQQVLGWIADQRQFRREHDIGARFKGAAGKVEDLGTVAGQIADRTIHLSNCDFDCHDDGNFVLLNKTGARRPMVAPRE